MNRRPKSINRTERTARIDPKLAGWPPGKWMKMHLKSDWFCALVVLGIFAGATTVLQAASMRAVVIQNAPVQERVAGEVASIDNAGKQITLTTAKAETFVVRIGESTTLKRVPPGATALAQAVQISFSEIAVGDRLLAIGAVSADRKTIAAQQVLVVSRGELEKKYERDKEEWRRRGVTGVVMSLEPESKSLKAQVRTPDGSQTLTLIFTDSSRFRRYAADSVAYKDTTAGAFEQLKVGDTFRALGNKSQDGASYSVEEILAGTFRVIPATISAVDASAGELKVNELGKQETLTVVTNKDTRTRRLSKELAAALAGSVDKNGRAPEQSGAGQNSFQQQIEQMPQVNLSDLKVGDMVLLTSAAEGGQPRITAIALIAGVEPVLKPLQEQIKANRGQPNYKLGLPESLSSLGVSLP